MVPIFMVAVAIAAVWRCFAIRVHCGGIMAAFTTCSGRLFAFRCSMDKFTAVETGLQVRKPTFGIRGIDKDDLDTAISNNNKPTIERIEKENSLPSIAKIVPLRQKLSKESSTHSIVIFTTDAHAADRCIKRGIYFNYSLYPAERYAPQLQTTQCFVAASRVASYV
jgi:hypothetical protein